MSSNDDLKKKTVSSLIWKLFEQSASSFVSLVVQIVMARLLAPDEFGMLAIMLVFVNVGNVIVQSGLNTAIIQGPDVTERDYSTVFWMSFVVSLVLYVIVFAAAPAIAAYYVMPSIVAPLRALVLILIVNAYNSIQEAVVARALEFNKTARATVIAGVTSGALGIISAVAGTGIWALVVQQLLFQVVKSIVLAVQIPWKPRFLFDAGRARLLFSFSWKLLVSGLLEQGYQSLSDLMIGKVFDSSSLGFVSQGKKYPQALGLMLDGAIQPVMLSAVARVQDNKENVKRLARRALKTSTFLIAPSMVLFAFVSKPIVLLLLGEKWLACVPYLRMYCFVYALLPVHTTNLQVLNGVGRSDLYLRLEVIKKIIGVSILCATVFVFRDLTAIVFGYVLSSIICTFVNAHPNKRVIGYSYLEQIRDICPAFILAVAAGAVSCLVVPLNLPVFASIVLQSVVMAVAYLLLAYMLKIEEMTYLLDMLAKLRK
ncbi:lipopolysaccharide biosynthesis protein [Paratractidigestivibacter sp.]|uniref:lipopolysaccharide biosynthesis protein n=1 Tax=Paratractidigestivibacter sp. TaxID=2847316 RepID=UPI002AC8DF20|nr:lipopolysaccharide biosynthesis protein [Paratractidigestivibacter sp.]